MPQVSCTALVTLKPVNFFERNPGIDVKASHQEDNKSVLVGGEEGCSAKGESIEKSRL